MNSILNTGNLTLAQKQTQAYLTIQNKINGLYSSFVSSYNGIMKDFWNNSQGLSPQEVSDSLGTSAASLFYLGGQTQIYLSGVNPEASLFKAPSGFLINSDGTVIISGVS